MSDTISRKGVFIPDITVEMFRNASLESIEDLMASGEMEDILLPSTQPEQRWIPCSERLPEKSGRYLVTNTQWGAYHVDWNIYYVNVEGHCDGWLWEQGCIAWMPFPEPYREERTEE